jgi:uncharacterized membrane protein
MSTETVFSLQLVLGYVPWLLFLGSYVRPKLRSKEAFEVHRAIATLHSFRFFGLAFIVPGVVGPHLPADFAIFAAYGDLAAGTLAMLALITTGIRPLFWFFTGAFNIVGVVDLIVDYYHGATLDLPSLAGQLGAAYIIPIIYVPLLMITHVAAFYLLARPQAKAASRYLECAQSS